MLKVVINWTYYKQERKFFNDWNSRMKKNCVFFYDYDDYAKYIIDHMDYSELQKFRLNIYNYYHKLIKFSQFSEYDVNNWIIEWLKISSPIIEVDNTDFANLLPKLDLKRRYFDWDRIREKYTLKSNFINYIQQLCPLM